MLTLGNIERLSRSSHACLQKLSCKTNRYMLQAIQAVIKRTIMGTARTHMIAETTTCNEWVEYMGKSNCKLKAN